MQRPSEWFHIGYLPRNIPYVDENALKANLYYLYRSNLVESNTQSQDIPIQVRITPKGIRCGRKPYHSKGLPNQLTVIANRHKRLDKWAKQIMEAPLLKPNSPHLAT